MSIRLYRRVRLGSGTTLNIGKTGLSLSIGTRGAHMTFGSNGTRVTLGIPGTGLFWSQNITASEKQRIRAENKRQREERYTVERERRLWDRQQKKYEKELEKERLMREKQANLDNIKSEYEQFQRYLADISHFHNVNMVSAKSAQENFYKRCQPLEFQSPTFFVDNFSQKMRLFSQDASKPLEKGLFENREKFLNIRKRLAASKKKLKTSREKLNTLKKIEEILTRRQKCLNNLSGFLGLLVIGIILSFFIIPVGVGIFLIGLIGGAIETLKNIQLIINHKANSDLKKLDIQPKNIQNAINNLQNAIDKDIPAAINADTNELINEIAFYKDSQRQIDLIVACCRGLEDNLEYNNESNNIDISSILNSDVSLRKYNSYTYEELKDGYFSWMYPDKYKAQWQERENKRLEFLKNVTDGNIEAISELCDALLPLSVDINYPQSFRGTPLENYEVGYHIETAKEGWLLIELPDIDIVPAYWAQLSPAGNSLSYSAASDRKRFNLYEKFAASFSLLHVLLLYLTYPFFEKIWIEAYTMVIDSVTGMPRRKDIVEGWLSTGEFSNFNFDKVDPIEALKALKVKIYSYTARQFVEPTWADKEDSVIWASREKDFPDGLLPF